MTCRIKATFFALVLIATGCGTGTERTATQKGKDTATNEWHERTGAGGFGGGSGGSRSDEVVFPEPRLPQTARAVQPDPRAEAAQPDPRAEALQPDPRARIRD
jgi:hypothetical protein